MLGNCKLQVASYGKVYVAGSSWEPLPKTPTKELVLACITLQQELVELGVKKVYVKGWKKHVSLTAWPSTFFGSRVADWGASRDLSALRGALEASKEKTLRKQHGVLMDGAL